MGLSNIDLTVHAARQHMEDLTLKGSPHYRKMERLHNTTEYVAN